MGMRSRFLAFALGAVLGAALAVPAVAQEGRQLAHPPRDMPKNLPKNSPKSDLKSRHQTADLNTLFDALKIAPDEDSAKAIEERIWAAWAISGSDTTNLLMSRVKVASDDKDYDLAIKLLNAVIAINPSYVEAWNERATVYYQKEDIGHAIADLGEVLQREPRHFGALSGLGMILQEIGDDKHALEAYRKALAVDPHLEHIPDVVKTLTEKVEGRDI
jgi:tetratricopeptide (TPR) repeat protein